MKILSGLVICSILGSCTPKPPSPVVAPVGPSTAQVQPATDATIEALKSQVSKLSAAAGVILDVNGNQPAGPNTEGVMNEAKLQKTIAGPARPEDEAEALKRKAIIQAGDLKAIAAAYATAQTVAQQANDRATKAEAELRVFQERAAKEQAANAAELQKRLNAIQADADARVAKVQDEARKAWMKNVNYVLLGLGAILILAAVANAFLTNGMGLGKSAILAGGAGLCFGLDYTLNQPWFEYVAIGATALTVLGVALWAYLEYREHKGKVVDKTIGGTAEKIVTTFDDAYEAATPEVKEKILDPIFDALSKKMDQAEKDAVRLLRYKGTASTTIPTPAKT